MKEYYRNEDISKTCMIIMKKGVQTGNVKMNVIVNP